MRRNLNRGQVHVEKVPVYSVTTVESRTGPHVARTCGNPDMAVNVESVTGASPLDHAVTVESLTRPHVVQS